MMAASGAEEDPSTSLTQLEHNRKLNSLCQLANGPCDKLSLQMRLLLPTVVIFATQTKSSTYRMYHKSIIILYYEFSLKSQETPYADSHHWNIILMNDNLKIVRD